MKHRMDAIPHPDVKPAVPRPTQLYDIYYGGKIEARGLPKQQAYALRGKMISTGRYSLCNFNIKPQ